MAPTPEPTPPGAEAVAYKVLTGAELHELVAGRFAGSPADRADGFVHLSTAAQLPGTLDRHFAGWDGDGADLHLAAVDLAALGPALRWEPARGGEPFPHLHGTLTLAAVLAHGPLARDAGGGIRLPVAG